MNAYTVQIPLDDIVVPEIDRPKIPDYDALCFDVKVSGVRVPIQVWEVRGYYILLNGFARYRAAKDCGFTSISATVRGRSL